MIMDFNDLMQRNYNSILKRGLITNKTTLKDFLDKMFEEVRELDFEANSIRNATNENLEYFNEIPKDYSKNLMSYELADVILVALNLAKHFNIDILKFLNDKIEINEKR